MSVDNLPRKNNSSFETKYRSIDPAAKPHAGEVQAKLLGNHKISGSMPIHSQLFQNWSEKNHPGIYIPHYLKKSEQ